MARDDVFLVRGGDAPGIADGQADRGVLNRMGMQITLDFVDWLVLAGQAFHMQIGTEDAPVNSTTSIDDALVWMLIDNPAGYAMIALLAELNLDFVDTAVNADAMVEFDKDKVRYSSGGTSYTPANLRGDDRIAFTKGDAYVGPDITAAAKSAVPNTVEFARKSLIEDAVTDPTTGKLAYDPVLYSAKTRPLICGVDACSFLVHFGAGTADLNGYGVLQVGQVRKDQIV